MKCLQLFGACDADTPTLRTTRTKFFGCLAVVAGACLLAAPRGAQAQANDPKPIQPPRDVTFTTKDRIELAGTYWESNVGREAPVIVLLHREGGNRLEWTKGIASSLQLAGYAVISVDLRGHGQSKVNAGANNQNRQRNKVKLIPQDYKNMVGYDLEAVKAFILDEHQDSKLNMNKTGIVGAEMGAAVAVSYALVDWNKPPHPDGIGPARTPRGQDVRALVLLSPEKVPGLPYARPLTILRNPEWNVHLLVAVGNQDRDGLREAEKLYELFNKVGQNENRSFLQIYPGNLRGSDLLTPKELNVETHITKFFEQSLKSLPANWRDRRSKLYSD